MNRWNYYFKACQAICVTGRTIEVPAGHGIVTLNDEVNFESVFFPSKQLNLKLLPGETRRLENSGIAERFGAVRG
jgi:hypothetical protein